MINKLERDIIDIFNKRFIYDADVKRANKLIDKWKLLTRWVDAS